MRRRTFCFILAIILAAFPAMSLAHSGRTDSNGGHYNRSTGEYHYHHGYGPHDHPGGVCPYDKSSSAAVFKTASPTAKPASATQIPYVVISTTKSPTRAPTAKPTAAKPTSHQQAESDLVLLLFPAGIAVGIVTMIFVCVGIAKDRRKLKRELQTTKDQLERAYTSLAVIQTELRSAESAIESKAAECDSLYNAAIKANEKSEMLINKNRLLYDGIASQSTQLNALRRQLDELGAQYNDLYAIWSASQLPEGETRVAIGEAMVYVGKSGVYHTRIHGDWHNYHLMPLREALSLRYTPCCLCVPSTKHNP